MIPAGFDPGKFILNQNFFDHDSLLHGINHTYRVMCHVLNLGSNLGWKRETRLAFCAAFIHDMSRKHDGYCTKHGYWSMRDKLPVFAEFFMSQGANSYELKEIGMAVKNHSEGFEIARDHPFYKTTALLKDADALDRIRLGDNNLNPSYLRLEPTAGLINFAIELYRNSDNVRVIEYMEMSRIAEKIPGFLSAH